MLGILKEKKRSSGPLINEKIRAPRMQLITHTGENIGVVLRDQALREARDVNLDLVLIADTGKDGVPVVKVMDFGKELYDKKKKQTEAKKHQKVIQVKEVKFRPTIGEHDYETKFKRIMQFLNAGKRVKVTIFFRGRENITKVERGNAFFKRIDDTFEKSGILNDLIKEKDSKLGQFWSRIYYLKSSK
ncbi:translation initiation factor IF-3 [Candidatus Dependentiae bacterium]|nr:translation initiation factor IF-3 [Candidatus Dependentiae bacterium]